MPLAGVLAAVLVTGLLLVGCSGNEDPGDATRVVQLGGPGEAPREVTSEDAASTGPQPHTDADVAFVQGMIHHHAQGVQMTALVADRSASEDLPVMAERMEISQTDEIKQMERWLAGRGEDVPGAADHSGHGGHSAHGGMLMPGMLTEEQMAALTAAIGPAFDRLFLESMIGHHQGARVMVADLWANDGGQEAELFRLAQHIDSDQSIEISRMTAMLSALGQ